MTETAGSAPPAKVDDVLITAELASRPSRTPDYQVESRALGLLAQEMAANPRGVAQLCAQLAMELCNADSAGISVLEPGGTSGILRWQAVAGAFAPNLHGTMPREASPCGTAMERNSVLLFSEAERFFPALQGVEPRIYENLLAPWHAEGKAVGTLWAIKHSPEGQFDAEDARLLQSLSSFAEAAFQMHESQEALASDLVNAERLRVLSERLVSQESLQAIYDEILSATIAITQADAGTVQIYDPSRKELYLIASQNFSRTITEYFHRVDAGSRTACGIALKTGERAFADFPEEVTDFGCQLLVGEGIQAAVAVPLMSRTGMPLGMLNAHWRHANHRPNERALRFLDLLARQAADLIEHGRSQNALRESEERLRSMAQAIEDVFYVTDLDRGRLDYLSPGYEAVWGRPAADLTADLSRFIETIHPDDHAAVKANLKRQARGEAIHSEYRIIRPDGQVRWILDRCFPIPDGGRRLSAGVASDITDRREAEERQSVLVAELQHRTRNIMAVVRSMADKTARASVDLGDFRNRFRERLEALSRTQGLLSRLNDHDRVTFDELIEAELAAMGNGANGIRLVGTKGVRLRSSMVQTLAMALHELATNAVKYGALGQANGQLVVTWRLGPAAGAEPPRLLIDWRESGVEMPCVGSKPRGGGQGRELIEKALPYQLSAKTSYELGPDGVHCTISIPVSTTSHQRAADA